MPVHSARAVSHAGTLTRDRGPSLSPGPSLTHSHEHGPLPQVQLHKIDLWKLKMLAMSEDLIQHLFQALAKVLEKGEVKICSMWNSYHSNGREFKAHSKF